MVTAPGVAMSGHDLLSAMVTVRLERSSWRLECLTWGLLAATVLLVVATVLLLVHDFTHCCGG
jgi:hypothetical protein